MRIPALLIAALAGVLSLYLSGQIWVKANSVDPLLGEQNVAVTGADVSPASALSLVILAGLAAGLLTKGWPRLVALAVTVLGGLGVCAAAVLVWLDPGAALTGSPSLIVSAVGSVQGAQTTWAVPAAAAGGLVAALAVILWAMATRGSISPDSTAVAPTESAAQTGVVDSTPTSTALAEEERVRQVAAWEDLSRGEDPTDGPRR